jgi:hypothetical protein
MYLKIKQDIKESYYLSYPNEGQRFIAWYLRNIHLRDLNETRSDITDGPDDKQIDAIYVDDNTNTIYVIQGKFIGENSVDSSPLREVLSSWVQLKDIVRLQESGNKRLQQKLSEVALALEDEYDIEFELITTGKLTSSAQNDLKRFQTELEESDELQATLRLVDEDELKHRYDLALDKENPAINHKVNLDTGRFIKMNLDGTAVVIAAIPLKECIRFPGIKDGTLFQKNVRQSLGLNQVNKGIRSTIFNSAKDFFFHHNGITALCSSMNLEGNVLSTRALSVVNGCQSLNTILSCSEKVKTQENSFVLFRFYEIPERNRADKISISTNSQSSVKARDLRSNDKRVLNLKRTYEQKYTQGYFITKRGEEAPADRNKSLVVDMSLLGKWLMSWQSQRPNIAYSENKIFDKYFDQIYRKEYLPENVEALSFWYQKVMERWVKDNPLGMNESLLAMKAYAPYHHLYAISLCFCVANKMAEGAPSPNITKIRAINGNIVDQLVDMAGACLNSALEAAANEPQPSNRVFSPQNWIKTKKCLAGIRQAISQYFTMLPSMPNGKVMSESLKKSLMIEPDQFEARWAAD